MRGQLLEREREHVRLVFEKLIHPVRVGNRLKDVSCQVDDCLESVVQEVALDAELQLSNVLAGDSLIVQLKELFADDQRINLFKLDRENELAVTLKLFEHFGVTILEAIEEDFDLLEDFFLRLRGVDPLGELVEELLLVQLAVLLTTQVAVHRRHAFAVGQCKTVFQRAAIQIQI